MRVSRDTMSRHHDEIVAVAARLLRQRGIEGLSVADVMQAAGLTHGGFYRHFPSKTALVADATTAAFDDVIKRFDTRTGRSDAAALKEYVANYLSVSHVEHPEIGCPIAAYGADIGREGDAVKAAFEEGLERLLSRIGKGLAGSAGKRRARAAELVSLLCGGVVAARASGSAATTREILAAVRKRANELIEAE